MSDIRFRTVFYEAVPWLMFAAALRILSVEGGLISLAAHISSELSIFLAFLVAAQRMIELTKGETRLGFLSLAQQVALARKVLKPIGALMLAASVTVYCLGARWTGLNLLMGFDGIAFDQVTPVGMVWSAFLAAVTLLLLLMTESTGSARLFPALGELWQRSACIVPAIIVVSFTNIGLSVIQGQVRQVVHAFWLNSSAPSLVRALVFFTFVFIFASIRLCVTLAILVFALRESYRRGHAAPASNTAAKNWFQRIRDFAFNKLGRSGTLVMATAVVAAFYFSMTTFAPHAQSERGFIAAMTKASWKVDVDKVKCVSVRPNRDFIFQKSYFDDPRIFEIMQASWPEKKLFRDKAECPYVFSYNIASHTTRAVKYLGQPSVVSMAFQVCPRNPDGIMTGSGCSYKSIYLFKDISDGIDAFEIGMKAYVLPPSKGTTVVSNGTEFTLARLSIEGIGK